MRIRTRLILGFAVLLVVTSLCAWYAVRVLGEMDGESMMITHLMDSCTAVLGTSSSARLYSFSHDEADATVMKAGVPVGLEALQKAAAYMSAGEKAQAEGIVQKLRELEGRLAAFETAVKAQDAGGAATSAAAGEVAAALSATVQLANEAAEAVTKMTEVADGRFNARMGTVIDTLVVGNVVAVLLGIAVAAYMTLIVTRPIARVNAFAERVAAGDFAAQLDVRGRDEYIR